MSESRRGLGIPIAALGLIFAVWLSLHFARSAQESEEAREDAEVALPESLEGFRADAWFLPDEALLGFVEIPAGPFVMGSDPAADPLAYDIERWSPSEPQGTVELSTYYIGRYEVTEGQFAAYIRDSGHAVIEPAALDGEANHPIVGVSWTDAILYAGWLQERLQEWPETPDSLARLLREGWRLGLPSEAEWEKAARDADGRIYPWGNQLRQDRANFRSRGTTAVGSFQCPECPYGLADMAGNVWELTRSPYLPYPFDPADDGRGDLDAESLFVMRGGSFSDGEQNIRAAVRGGVDPGARRSDIGFRLVISRF